LILRDTYWNTSVAPIWLQFSTPGGKSRPHTDTKQKNVVGVRQLRGRHDRPTEQRRRVIPLLLTLFSPSFAAVEQLTDVCDTMVMIDRITQEQGPEGSDDGGDDDDDRLSARDGLSLETLQALLQFQEHHCFPDDPDNSSNNNKNLQDNMVVIDHNTVCVAYTSKDSQVIAATYHRLQEKEARREEKVIVAIHDLEAPTLPFHDNEDTICADSGQSMGDALADVLRIDGVVRVNSIVDPDLCDRCLAIINDALENTDSATDGSQAGFGNVFSRSHRYDMYLRPEASHD
jgi:hypothetical protein